MTALARNFNEGIPRQWELFDETQLDFFENKNIDTREKVQNILENHEQKSSKPVDSLRQSTREKVNSIRSDAQEIPMTINGIRIIYLHRAENISENEATFTFRYNKKELCFSVNFERKKYRDFNDNNEYSRATNIKLKQPANFDGQHFVQRAKSERGEYFDFNLAIAIAKTILNDPRFA